MSILISFLQGEGLDHHGRKLGDILEMNDSDLEADHRYIQWLFPLKTMSENVWDSPTITDEEIELAVNDDLVQRNMRRALERMVHFYTNNDHWLREHDHNHLRISRMLISTRSMLGEETAREFYDMLIRRITEPHSEVSQYNMRYWKEAMDEGVDENAQPKIYLDIDGTLIHEDLTENYGKPAAGLEELIVALRAYDVYWLTTHCTDGNPVHAQNKLKQVLPEALYADIERIRPTVWQSLKTEALDFKSPFIWFDNDVMDAERWILKRCVPGQFVFEVNLRENPTQLEEITRDILEMT
jgi:hypothetical protein